MGKSRFMKLLKIINVKMEQAQNYWTNKSSGPLTELLIDGKIEVCEIIENY